LDGIDAKRGTFLIAFARRVLEHEDENASVGMKLASCRGLRRGERIGVRNVISLDDQPGS